MSTNNWHSTGKLNIGSVNDYESVKLLRNTSWSDISSAGKSKERSRCKPVRITLLSNSKPINQSARKRAQPERLKVLSYVKEDGLTKTNNVKEKSQQKNSMKMSLYNKNIQSNSKSNGKRMSFNVNKSNRKIRRNLNFNFVSLKQTDKNASMALPEVQDKNKSICSNTEKCNRKSFLVPPNFIKNKYLNERGIKVIPSSTVTMKNDSIKNVDVFDDNDNLHIKNSNVQEVSSFIQSSHDNSQMEINSKSEKLLRYNRKSKRNQFHKTTTNGIRLLCDKSESIRENITSIDNKIQKQERTNVNRSHLSMNKNIDNSTNMSNELNNIILTKESKVSLNDNNMDLSKKDYLYVDKNTIMSVKSYLEDILKVFQDSKTGLLLNRINKILHVNADSIKEEQVPLVDSNDEMIKETSILNLDASKVKQENNIDIVSTEKQQVELSEEEKENVTTNLEFQSDLANINHIKSSQSTPTVFQITIPKCTNFGGSALQDYTNLKESLNFLETPLSRKVQPRIKNNTNMISGIPKDKLYLSNKIFTALRLLYDE